MYEQAFFTPEYLVNHKKEEDLINNLKDLIACQIPLLECGLKLLNNQAPKSMIEMQKKMEKQLIEMKNRCKGYYGEKVNVQT